MLDDVIYYVYKGRSRRSDRLKPSNRPKPNHATESLVVKCLTIGYKCGIVSEEGETLLGRLGFGSPLCHRTIPLSSA